MKDYQLYHQYVGEFGLTFLPCEIHEDAWEIATKLMIDALRHIGPEVTVESVINRQHQLERDREKAA
jgi:hypothetical protein